MTSIEKEMTQRDLGVELEDIHHQLKRYGQLADEKLADILHEITNINDDMHHGRHKECVEKSVTKAKQLLDELLNEYR